MRMALSTAVQDPTHQGDLIGQLIVALGSCGDCVSTGNGFSSDDYDKNLSDARAYLEANHAAATRTYNQSLQPTLDSPFVQLPQPGTARLSAAELGCYAAQDTLPLAGKAGSICRRRDSAHSVRYCPKAALSATGFASYLRTRYAPTFSHIR